MSIAKPTITATYHTLPFDQLAPQDFERLCLWLLNCEGFKNVEHLGAAGNEQGRDLVARRNGRRWAFQCKKVRRFGPGDAVSAVQKVLMLPAGELPETLVLIVACNISTETRKRARAASAGLMDCQFWSRTELDARVKRYPHIIEEFFQVFQCESTLLMRFRNLESIIWTPQQAAMQLVSGIQTLSTPILEATCVDRNISLLARGLLSTQDIMRLAVTLADNQGLAARNPHLIQLLYVSHPDTPAVVIKRTVQEILTTATDYQVLHHSALALSCWGEKDALDDYLSLIESSSDADTRDTLEYLRYYGSLEAAAVHTFRKIAASAIDPVYRSTLEFTLRMLEKIALPNHLPQIQLLMDKIRRRATRERLGEVFERVRSRIGRQEAK